MKVKGPIFAVTLDHYACGNSVVFVYKVTEKILCVVHNNCAISYYRKEDGLPRSRERSGLSAIAVPRIASESRSKIERYMENHSLTEYTSGFELPTNAKGVKVWDAPKYEGSTFKWLRACGFTVLDMRIDSEINK